MTPSDRDGWRVDALVVLACLGAFGLGLASPFIRYDDPLYLFRNVEALGRPGLAGLLGVWDPRRAWSGHFIEYFPLRDSVYWALYQRFGFEPLAFHLTSLVAHVAASLLSRRLAGALGLSAWAAAAAALLFAVHPIHVESVVWTAGLKDPLYTTALFGSLLAWARFRERPRAALCVLSLALFVAALLVKSMAVSEVLLLLAMERLVGTPTPWRVALARLAPFALVGGAFLGLFVVVARANGVVLGPHGGGWGAHLVLSAWAQVRYLQQALVPSSFRLIYCFVPPAGVLDVRLLGAVLLFAAGGAALWRWRAQRLWRFGAAWYLACLLPVSNLLPFPALMADRYLYAAVLGVLLVLASGLERLASRAWVLGAAVLALTLTSATRSALWADEESLWEESDEDPACVADVSPVAIDAHLLRFRSTKDPRVALAALERALATPALEHSLRKCEVLQNAAQVAAELGQAERAEPWAVRATAECPQDPMSWDALLATTAHRRPSIALGAAEKAWRLGHGVDRLAALGLALLEADNLNGLTSLRGAVQQSPAEACPVVQRWLVQAPALAERLGDVPARCR